MSSLFRYRIFVFEVQWQSKRCLHAQSFAMRYRIFRIRTPHRTGNEQSLWDTHTHTSEQWSGMTKKSPREQDNLRGIAAIFFAPVYDLERNFWIPESRKLLEDTWQTAVGRQTGKTMMIGKDKKRGMGGTEGEQSQSAERKEGGVPQEGIINRLVEQRETVISLLAWARKRPSL